MEEQGIADTELVQGAPVPDTGVATGSDATDAGKSGQNATDAGKSGQQQADESSSSSSFPKEAIDEISRLRTDRRLQNEARIRAEAERDLLRRQAAEKERPTPAAAPVRAEPRAEQFNDPDEFRAAQFRYAVETTVDERLATERQNMQREATERAFYDKEAKAREKYDDYDEVTRDPAINSVVTPVIANAVLSSDLGPELHYYLAKHRDEAVRISKLDPMSSVRAIGRIEQTLLLGASNTTAPGKPPPPFKTVSGNSNVDIPLEKKSMEEYAAWFESEQRAGRI